MPKQVDFYAMKRRLVTLKQTLPRLLARDMVNHSKKAFRDQGFTDDAFTAWQKRKTQNRADRRTAARRAILIDSGALRRSIRSKSVNFREIRVGSYGIVYASRHNRGLDGMPKRQFIGRSKVLTDKMTKRVRNEFRKALKP
jgi:phage gpG-like protein